MVLRWWVLGVIGVVQVGACLPPEAPASVVSSNGEEQPITPRGPRVVSHAEAARSGYKSRAVSLAFGSGADGSQLIERLLKEADAADAALVSDISINLVASGEQGPTECRTAVVPESVTETREIPARYQLVSVQKPVTREVTENEYRCHMTSHLEQRTATDYQQRCSQVSRPVQRSRTSYSSQYDSFTKSSRSVPHTEYYSENESHTECRMEPVQRQKTESVPRNECRYEPVTHLATRYEWQLDNQYTPPQVEVYRRHRLRELEPNCFALEPATATPSVNATADGGTPASPSELPAAPAPSSRIEALFYFDR